MEFSIEEMSFSEPVAWVLEIRFFFRYSLKFTLFVFWAFRMKSFLTFAWKGLLACGCGRLYRLAYLVGTFTVRGLKGTSNRLLLVDSLISSP